MQDTDATLRASVVVDGADATLRASVVLDGAGVIFSGLCGFGYLPCITNKLERSGANIG